MLVNRVRDWERKNKLTRMLKLARNRLGSWINDRSPIMPWNPLKYMSLVILNFFLKPLPVSLVCILLQWHIYFITWSSTNTHTVAAVFQKLNSIEKPGKQIIITGIQISTQLQLHKVKYKCASFELQQVIYYWIWGF